MDARTFHPDNQIPMSYHMNFLFFTFHNLGGAISHSPEQKWYYYSMQSTSEVLVFHQYSKVLKTITYEMKIEGLNVGQMVLQPPLVLPE